MERRHAGRKDRRKKETKEGQTDGWKETLSENSLFVINTTPCVY